MGGPPQPGKGPPQAGKGPPQPGKGPPQQGQQRPKPKKMDSDSSDTEGEEDAKKKPKPKGKPKTKEANGNKAGPESGDYDEAENPAAAVKDVLAGGGVDKAAEAGKAAGKAAAAQLTKGIGGFAGKAFGSFF